MQSSRQIAADSLKKIRLYQTQIRFVSSFTLKKRIREYTDTKIASSLNVEEEKWLTEFRKIAPFLFVSCSPGQSTSKSLWRAKNILITKFLENAPRQMLQKNVDIFNYVLFGLANYPERNNEFKKLVALMKENDIKPNLRTISACLLSAANNGSGETKIVDVDDVKDILKWAEDSQLKLKCILLQRVHGLEETEKIIKTIRVVDKYFSPISLDFLKTEYQTNFTLLSSLKQRTPDLPYVPGDGPYANIPGLPKEKLMENVRRQLNMELDDKVVIPSIALPKHNKHTSNKNKVEFETLFASWRDSLEKALSRKIDEMKQSSNPTDSYLTPFLTSVDSKDIVEIMFDCAVKLSTEAENYSPPVSQIKHNLAKKVFTLYDNNLQLKQGMDTKIIDIYQEYCKFFADPAISREYNQRKYWIQSAKKLNREQIDVKVFVPAWGYQNVLMKIGKVLFDIIVKNTKHTTPSGEQSIFYVIHFGSGSKLREEIRVARHFSSKVIEKNPGNTLVMEVQECPMICPPIPWHGTTSGYHGFYSFKQIIMVRTPGEYNKYSKKVSDQLKKFKFNAYQKLFPAMDSLNQLGAIPWKINVPVLDVAIELFREGVDMTKYKHLDLPLDPTTLKEVPLPEGSEKKAIRKAHREFIKKKKETNSLFATVLYRLSLASHFRNDVLWFPHSFDFRGRVYPVPPHLNHMGDDLCRGILLFAKGRKLGKDGLDWLKIHCINLTDLKKHDSIAERLKYANEEEVLNNICMSAIDPIHTEWWKTFEKPWQVLACCIEIRNALDCTEGPENYMCRYPIHQDGCCNGLQHYAALGRDKLGAEQVNLVENEKPNDVYTSVMNKVKEKVKQDAIGDGKDAEIAKLVEPLIVRKTIKQTVMTICYGVTMYGAKLQILKQLKDIVKDRNDAKLASSYLAKITFKSIGELFNNSRKIQKWLEKSAGLLSGECKQPVTWITPLGFPVFQPYFRQNASKKSKPIRIINGKAYFPNVDVPIKTKQTQAFPPNFVHSLDSTHMMMTALNCQHRGITYASVHDCYWTHPDTVAEMNIICREQFVHLYNQAILEDLSEQFNSIFDKWLDKNNSCTLPMFKSNERIEEEAEYQQTLDDANSLADNSYNEVGDIEQMNNSTDDEDYSFGKGSLINVPTESEIYIRNIFTDHPKKGDFDLNLVKGSTYFFS